MREKEILIKKGSMLMVALCFVVGIITLMPGRSMSALKPPEGTVVCAVASLGNEQWLGVYEPVMTNMYSAPCYDFLFKREIGSGRIGPGLVKKSHMSPDAMTYTIWLRKGVQFHAGWGELTAEDVKYSIELARSEGSRNFRRNKYQLMGRLEIMDRYQLRFHFTKPDWAIEYALTDVPYLPIISKKYVETVGIEKAGKHPIGSGPFKFVEHRLGNYIKFEAVENHWRKTPYIKTLIIKKVPEPGTRIAMLRTGEAHLIEIKHESIEELKAAGLKIHSIPNGCFSYMSLLGQWLPTREGYDPTVTWAQPDKEKALKVRKALSFAINREEIVEHVLKGYGTEKDITAAILWWPGQSGWNPEWKEPRYDPERAKQLLVEAGYPTFKDLEVTVDTARHTGRPYGGDIAEAVALQWSNLGITVKMQLTEFRGFFPKLAARDRSVAGVAWCYPGLWGDEPIIVLRGITQSISRGLMVAESRELDKLLESVPDEQKREQLQRKLGDYVYNNRLGIPIAYSDIIFGISPRLEWPTVGPAGQGYIHNCEYMKFSK